MTSSGVATYNPSLVAIVAKAYRKANLIRDDETPSGTAYSAAVEIINDMVGIWAAQNIRVWTLEEGVLFLQPNQYRYQLGTASTDEMSDAFDYLQTTLSAAAAAAATSVVLTATTPLANADRIGIELDTGLVQWTTVSSIAGSPTITIAAALTGAAASGNRVFAYTTRIIRPMKIERMSLINWDTTPIESPLISMSRFDYMSLPNKTSQGPPNQFHFSPKLPLAELFVSPSPDTADVGLRFTYQRPIFDFVASSDTADLPREWQMVLVSGLAYHLAVQNQAPTARITELKSIYEGAALVVMSWDREAESIYMQPDIGEG